MVKNHCFRTSNRPSAAGVLVLLLLLTTALCCCDQPDRLQVQIAVHAADFKPFAGAARDIIYGPYCLNVTRVSAVVAWEEKSRTDTPRHVAVALSGLAPATEYVYRVNGAAQDGRLKTAPADDGPFSFLAVGDTQTGPEVAAQVAAHMLTTDPAASFFLHLGDMVGGPNSAKDWQDCWWTPLSGLLLQMPVFPVMGNHDEGSEFYKSYFRTYRDTGRNYSFDWGQVHFVVLDFCNGIDADDENITWLKSDLQEHQGADYIIVSHHYPLYFSDTGYAPLPTKMQTVLAPIYEQYGVQLVLGGHLHGYQHHLANNIHYVISAGGGGKIGELGEPLEGITVCQHATYNFLHCRSEGAVLQVTAYDAGGNSFDACSIEKK